MKKICRGKVFYMGELMIKSMKNGEWEGSSINDKCIFQSSKYCNSENFTQLWCDIHLKIVLNGVMEIFILEINN